MGFSKNSIFSNSSIDCDFPVYGEVFQIKNFHFSAIFQAFMFFLLRDSWQHSERTRERESFVAFPILQALR